MRSRRVSVFQSFRRRICPRITGWLIAAQLLPLVRVEARTPLPDMLPGVGIAGAMFAGASSTDASAVSASSPATSASEALPPATTASPAPVVVNRTVPNVAAPKPFAGFSSSPTDQEFFRGRIFEEPLVPIGRPTTLAENQALAHALETYRHDAPEAVAPIDAFLQEHPDSPWRASVLANVGIRLRDAGAYAHALAMWDETWTLARDATNLHGRAVADLALAEWLRLSVSLMRIDQVEARLASIGERDVRGTAGNRVKQVRERVATWRAHPESFVPAEQRALERLSSFERKDDRTATSMMSMPRVTTPNAVKLKASRPLGWLIGPAKKLGLTLRAMRRGAGASFTAGALVPMKNGQILALLEPQGDRFLAYDPLLNRDLSVSSATLHEMASDFALISRAAATGAGWTEVAAAALPVQSSMCDPGTPDDHEPCCGGGAGPAGPPPGGPPGGGPPGSGGPPGGGPPAAGGPPGAPPPGMPAYRFHHAIAGLIIQDEPVTYSVPRGPSPRLGLSYGSRSVENPQVFTFGNFGPKWRFDWLAYVQERPIQCWSGACVDDELRVTLPGGGMESYEPPPGTWTTLGPHWRSRAVIVRTSSSPLQYERRLPDASKEVYGVSEGAFNGARLFLTDVVDPQGQTVHLTYDAQLRLVSLTDAIGQVTTLSYEHASDPLKITKVTDPFGRFATFTYNAAGQLESITDAIGLTSSFSYGKNDFIVGMMTPYGTTTFRQEDILAVTPRYLEATDPLGGTERVEYWMNHASLPATVPASEVPTGLAAANHDLNQYVGLYWDKRAMALQPRALASATVTKWLLRAAGADYSGGSPNTSIPYYYKRPLEGRIWYRYPNQTSAGSEGVGTGMQPSVVARVLDDGSSQIWLATYNTLGHVTSRTDPLGRRMSFVYAADDIDLLEVRQTTGSMNESLATYGNYTTTRRPQTITDVAGQITTMSYNSAGQMLAVTNPKSETTTYVYDSNGRPQSVTAPMAGATTTFAYDVNGRLSTKTTADGHVTTFEYDQLDRATKKTYPDGTFEEFTYARLDLVAIRDRLGRVTRRTHDAVGHVTSVRDPAGRTITQQWCACGSLDAVMDAKGQRTKWERDLRGRVIREYRADGVTTFDYAYELATSRLKTTTDPANQVATYVYNADDTLQSMSFTNAQIATPSVSFTYDPAYSRPTTMIDGTGTTTYTYHPVGVVGAGQLATVDGPLANDTIAYSYDQLGRATQSSVATITTTMTYDALGRNTSETNPLGTFLFGYDGVSNRQTSTLYPNNQSTQYAYYDNLGDFRLKTIHNRRPGGAALSRFDYVYNSAGNIVSAEQQYDGATPSIWSYGYDAADQLLTARKQTVSGTPALLERLAYTYDAAGNRTSAQNGDTVVTFTHDAMDRLLERRPGGVLRFAGTVNEPASVTIQGNPAQVDTANVFGGTAALSPTANVITIRAVDPSGNSSLATFEIPTAGSTSTFTYDVNGNMTSDGARTFEWNARNQLVAANVGTKRNEWTYDGYGRRTRLVEKNNGVQVNSTDFVWCGWDICEQRSAGGTLRFYAEGVHDGSTALFYAMDRLGSVREVIDVSGTVQQRMDYDPNGRVTLLTGSSASEIGFTGHRFDSTTGLDLAWYRAYDPELGRWLSQDPLGHGDGPNLYTYTQNNPVRYLDYLGLQTGCLSKPRPPCTPVFHRDVFRACFVLTATDPNVALELMGCLAIGAILSRAAAVACAAYVGYYTSQICYECSTFCEETGLRGGCPPSYGPNEAWDPSTTDPGRPGQTPRHPADERGNRGNRGNRGRR